MSISPAGPQHKNCHPAIHNYYYYRAMH